MKRLLLFAAAAMSVTTAAHASLIPVTQSISADLGNGQYLWDYAVTLSADAGLTVGSKFVIYDFQGYVPGSIKASYNAPFVASTELVTSASAASGGVMPDPLYGDDPNVVNLVFTYENFPDFQTSGGPGDTVTIDFFSALSTSNAPTTGGYGSRDIINYGFLQGGDEFNEGLVAVPKAMGDVGCQADAPCDVHSHPGGVPEPASWALMILGFGGAGAMLRRDRQRRAGLVGA